MNSPPYEELEQLSMRLMHEFRQDAFKALIPLGLTPMQAMGLVMVAKGCEQPSELAQELGTSPAGVSQLLAGLEERGWLGRSTAPEDRRKVRLSLTESGQAFIREVEQCWRAATAPRIRRLSLEEVQTLIQIYRKLLSPGVKP
jgi:DNA-binding MarR family transcriptional regulator